MGERAAPAAGVPCGPRSPGPAGTAAAFEDLELRRGPGPGNRVALVELVATAPASSKSWTSWTMPAAAYAAELAPGSFQAPSGVKPSPGRKTRRVVRRFKGPVSVRAMFRSPRARTWEASPARPRRWACPGQTQGPVLLCPAGDRRRPRSPGPAPATWGNWRPGPVLRLSKGLS